MSWAALFPGQGSQAIGMGLALAEAFPIAARTWEEANDTLRTDLRRMAAAGPLDLLTRTDNAQPAILACSVAAWRVLQEEGDVGNPSAFAGHSLGEWSALVAAEALGFTDAVRLVRARGRFMQTAVPQGIGGMAAVIGLDVDSLRAACAEIAGPGEVLAPANFNGGGQIVIAGHTAAIDRCIDALKLAGARRVVRLEVSAPFHCELMAPAANELAPMLAEIEFGAPTAPVWTNVAAEPNQDPGRIAELLVSQITSPVRWQETMAALTDHAERAIEVGHGKVLAGLARRIEPTLKVLPCGGPDDLSHLN